MHQFGHIFCLQQELLYPRRSDWFRAFELFHAARHEGVSLNVEHYNAILRQVVSNGSWLAAVNVVYQMRREGLRLNAASVGCALASCAESGAWEVACSVFYEHCVKGKLRPTDHVVDCLMQACRQGGREEAAKAVAREAIAAGAMPVALLESHADSTPDLVLQRVVTRARRNAEQHHRHE